jgi:hypothetical protein
MMKLEKAQEILDMFGYNWLTIVHDKTLKMYQVFLFTSVAYISEENMKAFDEPEFKTAVAQALVREAALRPDIVITKH